MIGEGLWKILEPLTDEQFDECMFLIEDHEVLARAYIKKHTDEAKIILGLLMILSFSSEEEHMNGVENAGAALGDKNSNAVALGRLGGLKGGKARAASLTPERRKEIAAIAANARWNRRV